MYLHWSWGRLSYLALLFFGTLHSNGYIFPFLLCFLPPFFSQLFVSLLRQPFWFFFIFFFLLLFFLLYNIILVLPYINMHLPQVYMCSQSWTPLPPPSPYHPSGSSQCTSPKLPVSWIEPGLAIHFLYNIIYIWISSNEVDETGAYYTEWSKLEIKTPFWYFAFLFLGDGVDSCLLYNVTNLHP